MTIESLTKADAERLAAFLHGIRPDWYITETTRALGEATKRPTQPDASQIAIAAIRCAANPANGTPARIPLAGEHWNPWPGDTEPPTPTPPPLRSCRTCGAYITEPDHEQHCARRATAETYATGAAAVRAELAAARAAHPTPPEETTP